MVSVPGLRTATENRAALAGLNSRTRKRARAGPERPIWVINAGPIGGRTAYVNTWALGELKPKQIRRFTWSVTSTVPGTHTLSYRVAGGLNGNAERSAREGGARGNRPRPRDAPPPYVDG